MKKIQKAGIVMLSAVVLGGVAPAVAPSVLNLNGSVVYAAEETHKVTIYYDLYDDPMSPFSSSSSNKVVYVTPNQPLSDHIPETLPGGYVFAGARAHSGGSEGESLATRDALFGNWTIFYVTYPKSKRSGTNPNNAGTEVKPNNDGNANAGANNGTSEAQVSNQQAKQGSSTVTSANGKVEAKKASNTAAGSDLPLFLAMVGSALALFSQLFKKSTEEE